MADPTLASLASWAYTPALVVTPGMVHATPPSSPGGLLLQEQRHDCVQLAGFGRGDDLASWLRDALGPLPAPGQSSLVLDGSAHLIPIGPATWLLLGRAGALRDFLPAAIKGLADVAAITDFSDGRNVVLALQGASAVEVLAMHLGMPLDDAHFAVGASAATGIHHIAVVVLREAADTWLVLVQRSFATSLWDILLDCAAPHGATVAAAA